MFGSAGSCAVNPASPPPTKSPRVAIGQGHLFRRMDPGVWDSRIGVAGPGRDDASDARHERHTTSNQRSSTAARGHLHYSTPKARTMTQITNTPVGGIAWCSRHSPSCAFSPVVTETLTLPPMVPPRIRASTFVCPNSLVAEKVAWVGVLPFPLARSLVPLVGLIICHHHLIRPRSFDHGMGVIPAPDRGPSSKVTPTSPACCFPDRNFLPIPSWPEHEQASRHAGVVGS